MDQEREDRFVILRFEVLQSRDLSPSEKLVYARICGFKKYFESKEECADVLGVSKDTVVKAKQKLLKLGYVKEIGNTGRGKIYQSVYDDNDRVVRSTNQSGRKAPIRVVDSTTIEEREKKERVNKGTIVPLATPETYGKSEINDLFEYWKQCTGYAITSHIQNNRNACNNLIKKHTTQGVMRLVQGVSLAQKDKFAPRVSDFVSLQAKTNDLILWGKNNKNKGALVL